MYAVVAVPLVFAGCCFNVVCLEILITDCPGSGNIIFFSQFLFVTITGFIFTHRFGKTPRSIPLMCYVKMTFMYAFSVIFQNGLLYLQFDIPLQQLLRSGTLIANLVLSVTVLNKTYRWSKYLSVMMISVGIGIATVASTDCVARWQGAIEGSVSNQFYSWLLGLLALLFGFYISAYMGIYQEIVFSKYGKHCNEALFYNHALTLPFFIFLSKDIARHVVVFSKSAPVALPWLNFSVPKLWLYLMLNVFTHYMCVSSVFSLTAQCSSLTVNLIVTLRKFVSLLLSVIYFENNFTVFHWLGTFLVFSGTLLFTDLFSSDHGRQSTDEVVSEQGDHHESLSSGEHAASTISLTDNVMRHRITSLNKHLQVNTCRDNSVSYDTNDRIIGPQRIAVNGNKADDLRLRVLHSLASEETVLIGDVILDAARDGDELLTTADDAVSDEHLKST